jgi:ABC-2 type transport system permease protein
MEDIMATPIQPSEMLLGKLVPYFFLGLGSMALCVLVAIILFHVPFRGSFFVLFLSTSAFLLPSLAQGLLISSTTRDQFVACQVSIMLGFLPGLLLSDVVFDISSMPWLIQIIAYAFPHRYFVINLENGFLVSGTSWNLILPNIFFMLLIAFFLLGLTRYKMRKKLD